MKSIKMALLAGAALAVTAAGAQADDLDALKAQIEALNARVAAMEATPAVPAGYQLVAISEGAQVKVPGLERTAREQFLYGDKATVISVLPTADAPAATTITWSGYVRAALAYSNDETDINEWSRANDNADWVASQGNSEDADGTDDWDVFARGEITVVGVTDTAVGEVGAKVTLRGDFDGNGNAEVSMPEAWGWWAMTPELTFGGGYTGSLGNIGYGMDGGACCFWYNDTVDFNPGDTTQLRLSYASGPFSMAVALEDASTNTDDIVGAASDDRLGVAGEVKYSGDMFSGEISGVYRSLDDNAWDGFSPDIADDIASDASWQIGAGAAIGLGEVATLSLAAAMGEGPATSVDTDDGLINSTTAWNNTWWGVSGLVAFNMTDEIHAEVGAGYKSRDFDDISNTAGDTLSADAEEWAVAAGLYYNPVDQLTIGLEGSYEVNTGEAQYEDADASHTDYRAESENTDLSIDFVSVWRF